MLSFLAIAWPQCTTPVQHPVVVCWLCNGVLVGVAQLPLTCVVLAVVQIVKVSLTGDHNDNDIVAAPKLLDVVLQHCKGAVDVWVEPYVHLALDRLSSKQCSRSLRDELVLLVANALIYNAALALTAIQKVGATAVFFGSWFQMIFARR
jgi:hypothetical protein